MAFTGWTTANYVSVSSGLITAAPLSFACWVKVTGTGTNRNVLSLSTSGSAGNRNAFRLLVNSSDLVSCTTSDGSATSGADASGTVSTNTWTHAAGVIAAANSRSAYRDGGNKVTETTSRTPTGINRTAVGISLGTSTTTPLDSGDAVAEAGIWNVALTDDEIVSLSKGAPPTLIRPQNLVAYLPLTRELVDYKGNAFSITGSLSVVDHCRIYGLVS